MTVGNKETAVKSEQSRRDWLTGTSMLLGSALAGSLATPRPLEAKEPTEEPFSYCLNTSTIQGQKLSLIEEIEIAARVGYHGIEPWIRELDQFVKDGGRLKDLGKRIRDLGLSVESAIGFCEWIVDDEDRRRKGLEEARRSMEMVQQIGGKRLAAPPAGATNEAGLDLAKAAQRYRTLLELGGKMGVIPQVELWGFSKTLSRLGETLMVAIDSGHRQACILVDVYHLYKGGSGFSGLRLVGGEAMHVIHMNDYPASPPRDLITDAYRVYPGDGVAPLKEILRDLRGSGFRGMLSLELFNRDYWNQDAVQVARTGLEKMCASVRSTPARQSASGFCQAAALRLP